MQFTLKIESSNDAFTEAPQHEIESALNKVLRKVELGHTEGTILDTNGNSVGAWRMTQ